MFFSPRKIELLTMKIELKIERLTLEVKDHLPALARHVGLAAEHRPWSLQVRSPTSVCLWSTHQDPGTKRQSRLGLDHHHQYHHDHIKTRFCRDIFFFYLALVYFIIL